MADSKDNKPMVIIFIIVLVGIIGVASYLLTNSKPQTQVMEKIAIPKAAERIKLEPLPESGPEPEREPLTVRVVEVPVEDESHC